MPPFTGRHGIRDFTEPTTATNPKQPCDLPHEGDPFCGNDNNRRAVLAKMREEAKANPDAFDAKAAVVLLGGEERIKKAIAGIPQFRDMNDEPAPAPEPTDDDDDSKGSTDGDTGSQDAPPTDTQGDEAKDEQKTTVKPPKPPAGTAPAWKPNA